MVLRAFWALAASDEHGLGARFATERVARLIRAAEHPEFSHTLVSSYGSAQRALETTMRIEPPTRACALAVLSMTVERAYMHGVTSGTFAQALGARFLSAH